MTHLVHLELLDLSFNKISTLSEATRLALNQLEAHPEFRTTKHLFLNLEGNPLQCTCLNLGFLNWMENTRLILVNLPNYRCMYSNIEEGNMSKGISQIVALHGVKMWREQLVHIESDNTFLILYSSHCSNLLLSLQTLHPVYTVENAHA